MGKYMVSNPFTVDMVAVAPVEVFRNIGNVEYVGSSVPGCPMMIRRAYVSEVELLYNTPFSCIDFKLISLPMR